MSFFLSFMDYELFTLKNGIRVIHKHVSSPVAHVGMVINTGSRDEDENEHGMAHFIEHVIFKGTRHRKAYHIISRIEDVGGEIDAYTTKEETVVHASFLKEYYDRTLELLYDIVFQSVFPEKEIAKEKEVILDEINSYKDSPGELIFDDFEDLVFQNHPLGRNILGSPKSVSGFKRQSIIHFIQQKYHTNQMVICSVGNIQFRQLCRYVEKHFGLVTPKFRVNGRKPFTSFVPITKEIKKKTYQTHYIMGTIGFRLKDERRTTLALLNDILGGPGMNSRLNIALREKHGLTYNIESFYSSYSDTGITGIYFGTDFENIGRCEKIIRRQLHLMQTQKMGILQLERAKRQLIGQIAISSENNSALMLTLGKSLLAFDKVDSIEEIVARIRAVKADDVLEIANLVWDPLNISRLIYY